jgi:hypothetical protein
MPAVQVLYPNSQLYKTLENAPHRFGYLFHVTCPDGHEVDFVLQSWLASDSTIDYLEREGHTVQVVPIAYEPDEGLLNALLAQASKM